MTETEIAGAFHRITQRMERSGIATRKQLRGVSAQEIEALERRYRIRLPATYRSYLSIMGHRSGKLFTSDHMAVTYPYVLNMTAELESPPGFQLPAGSLVIAGRLAAAWEFIHCDGAADSPLWYFDEGKWTIRPSQPSVLAWLECWCGIAEQAIADGYFVQNPNGTTP